MHIHTTTTTTKKPGITSAALLYLMVSCSFFIIAAISAVAQVFYKQEPMSPNVLVCAIIGFAYMCLHLHARTRTRQPTYEEILEQLEREGA
jgi:positive regulator of sigma E activity